MDEYSDKEIKICEEIAKLLPWTPERGDCYLRKDATWAPPDLMASPKSMKRLGFVKDNYFHLLTIGDCIGEFDKRGYRRKRLCEVHRPKPNGTSWLCSVEDPKTELRIGADCSTALEACLQTLLKVLEKEKE